jgi:HEAT repeat protein
LENGNRLVNVEQGAEWGTHRLVEVNQLGLTVWESIYEHSVAGLLICPMVRFGFDMQARTPNLEEEKHRVGMLARPENVVRREAAHWIAERQPTETSLQAALSVLDDIDVGTRCHALHLLGKAHPRKDALQKVVERLSDPNIDMRSSAKRYLENAGKMAIPGLVAAFEDQRGKDVSLRRSWAAYTLGFMVHLSDRQLTQTVTKALEDKDAAVRQLVVCALCQMKQHAKPFLPAIIKALRDPDKEVSAEAEGLFYELGEIGEPGVPHFLKLLDASGERKRNAISTLSVIGQKNSKVFPALVSKLKSETDAECVKAIIGALPRFRDSKSMAQTIQLLKSFLSQNAFRVDAITALGRCGKQAKELVPSLVKIAEQELANQNPRLGVLSTVVSALNAIDPEAAKKVKVLRESHQTLPHK